MKVVKFVMFAFLGMMIFSFQSASARPRDCSEVCGPSTLCTTSCWDGSYATCGTSMDESECTCTTGWSQVAKYDVPPPEQVEIIYYPHYCGFRIKETTVFRRENVCTNTYEYNATDGWRYYYGQCVN